MPGISYWAINSKRSGPQIALPPVAVHEIGDGATLNRTKRTVGPTDRDSRANPNVVGNGKHPPDGGFGDTVERRES